MLSCFLSVIGTVEHDGSKKEQQPHPNNSRNFRGDGQTFAGLLNGAKGATNGNHISITMTIHNPQGTGANAWSGTSSHGRAGVAYFVNYFGGDANVNFQATNMQFYQSSGTANLNFQSYGIKTS